MGIAPIVFPTRLFYCLSYFRISPYAEDNLSSTSIRGKMGLFTSILLYGLGPVIDRKSFPKSSFYVLDCSGLMKEPKYFWAFSCYHE